MIRSLSRPVYASLLARVPAPINLDVRAHWHGYVGRDRALTIYIEDNKENEIFFKV